MPGPAGPAGPPGIGLIGSKVMLYLYERKTNTKSYVYSIRIMFLQGSVGRTGAPGPPGLPGEGSQGPKVPAYFPPDDLRK